MELIKIYNGSTVAARELYHFLDLKKAHWKRWYTKNIIDNPFAIEGEDWEGFTIMVNGNQSMDFSITLDFAKKLTMLARSQKGEEARNYFLKCEKTIIALKQNKRLEAFTKLETTKNKLHQNVVKLGGDEENYIQIDTSGRKIFFNGQLIADEELSTLALKGRDFATELTNDILSKGNHRLEDAEEINKEQHNEVRNTIIKGTGQKPEELPRVEEIEKLGE